MDFKQWLLDYKSSIWLAMFENEKENMKGIFNILKKKKIQNQIDELLDDLKRI